MGGSKTKLWDFSISARIRLLTVDYYVSVRLTTLSDYLASFEVHICLRDALEQW
jgi:hypothetical protein